MKSKSWYTAAFTEHIRMKMCYIPQPQQGNVGKKLTATAARVQPGQHPSQVAPWDPIQPLCRQNYICCTLKEEFHPNPFSLPAPSQMSAQNLHAKTLGQCHFRPPAEHTTLLQLSPDEFVMNQTPAEAQLHLVLWGGCNHSTRYHGTARATQQQGGLIISLYTMQPAALLEGQW